MLDEAIEDLCDGKGCGEIDQQQDAHRNATPERVDENEENGSVDEVEAVRDLSEMMDGAAGQEAVKGAAVHCKDDEHCRSGDDAPIEQIARNGEVLDDTAGVGEPIENQGDGCDGTCLQCTEPGIPAIDRMEMPG